MPAAEGGRSRRPTAANGEACGRVYARKGEGGGEASAGETGPLSVQVRLHVCPSGVVVPPLVEGGPHGAAAPASSWRGRSEREAEKEPRRRGHQQGEGRPGGGRLVHRTVRSLSSLAGWCRCIWAACVLAAASLGLGVLTADGDPRTHWQTDRRRGGGQATREGSALRSAGGIAATSRHCGRPFRRPTSPLLGCLSLACTHHAAGPL